MSDLGNKNIFAQNLRFYMEHANRKPKDICDTLHFPMPTFSDWINAKTYPRIDKIEMLANYFGIMKSDLIERKETLPSNVSPLDASHLKRIPVLGRIAAGTPIYAEENIEGYTYTDLNGGAEYFGLRVRGDSMNAARIYDGDIVIIRRQDTVENGQIAAVLIDNEDATLKRFSQQGNIVTLMPQSTNPANQPFVFDLKDTSVKILGLVVRVEFTPA